MQLSTVPHSEVLAGQGQKGLPVHTQDITQIQDVKAPRLNWNANLTFYHGGEKGHLAQECPHKGSSAIAQRQQTQIIPTEQSSYTGPTLFQVSNPTLSQTITGDIPFTTEIWQIPMEQLNKSRHQAVDKGI